jgi:integrase
MASILKIGQAWRAQIRRKGHKAITETFPTKALAQLWARRVESEIDARKYSDKRALSDLTLGELINRYTEEIGQSKQFGKNKTAVLASLSKQLGAMPIAELTDDRLTKYVRDRRAGGAGGVTIGIDLSYLGAVYKTAKELWKLPITLDAITSARANMKHFGMSTKSHERDRRPTQDEIDRLCTYFDTKSTLPMRDIINFAVASAMRLSEITGLRWQDMNEADRTITIKNRKHPTLKQGNDQEVPLLGAAFTIAMRQPKGDRVFPCNSRTISSIFPRACHAIGIEDLTFHDLRHEGVSRLFEQGYTIEQVALVSGHRDWKMLARYTQIRAKDLHR